MIGFETTPSRFYHDISKRIVEQQPPCTIEISAGQYGSGKYTYILKGRKPDSPRFIKREYSSYSIPVREEKRRTLKCLNPEHNSYKYYTIWHEGGQTLVEYGRVGVEGTGTNAEKRFTGSYRYPDDMYWIKYYEKIAKGYRDYTHNMESEVVVGRKKKEEVTEIYPSKEYEKLYTYLRNYTKNHLRGMMSTETRDRITTRDIVEARKYLLKMSKTKDIRQFNTFLKEVLLLIPRYSERISDMMASTERDFQKILDREEDLIQAVEGIIIDSKNVVTPKKESDPLGCKIEKLSKEDWEIVNRAVNYKGAYKEVEVVEAYKLTTSKSFNPQGYATEFLWHGSRTENWISIIKNGLTTRPSSNVITHGSMFGSGLYFAPNPYKSYGYTSAITAYWTRGDYKKSAYGVMALCEVAVGKSYIPDSGGDYTKSYLEKKGFQSLWAKGKKTRMYRSYLKNDEVVIYSDNQVRIRYIVIVKER